MADTKISALTATTAPASTDILPVVVDPGGTPLSRKVTIANLFANAPRTVVTSNNAAAFEVGPNGSTNPAFRVVGNVSSAATGLSVTGNAAAAGVTLNVLSSGTNEGITINTKGTGPFSFTQGGATAVTLQTDGVTATGRMNGHWRVDNTLRFGNAGDLGAERSGAGLLEINNQTTGQFRDIKARQIFAAGDNAGAASTTSLTNAENTGVARGAGVGTIKFADGTSRDCAGFIKIYVGTTAYYVPIFAAN